MLNDWILRRLPSASQAIVSRVLIVVNILLVITIILEIIVTLIIQPLSASTQGILVQGTLCIQSAPSKPATDFNVMQSTFSSEYIGVSDGRFAFDIDSKRPDAYLKCRGAKEFSDKNYTDAASFWTQASQQESSDAEALIFRENAHILQFNLPHVTFIIGTILTGDDVVIGRSVLQGVYAKQEEYNRDPAHITQILLLLANFSSAAREDPVNGPKIESDVAGQIATVVGNDPTIKGLVMSLPFSSIAALNMLNCLPVVLSAGNKLNCLPVVLSAGFSATQIKGKANIFPITSSTEREGQVAAKYIQQKFHHVAIFADLNQNDTRSVSLENSFSSNYSTGQIVATELYTGGDTASIIAGATDVKINHHDTDLIYFPGKATDADSLVLALGPNNSIPVMGGADLYDPGGYSSNNYRNLYFTSFAFPDEWEINTQHHHPFTALYRQLFAGWPPDGFYGYTRPSNDVLLAYDGISTLLRGFELATPKPPVDQLTVNQLPVNSITIALRSIAGANAFQGFSGRISFGADSSQKAVVILSVNSTGYTQEETLVGCLLVAPCNSA